MALWGEGDDGWDESWEDYTDVAPSASPHDAEQYDYSNDDQC